jgi:hypothetical protein
MEIEGSPVPQAISSTRMPGSTCAASTIACVKALPMAADCVRHFWLAWARAVLFQSAFAWEAVTFSLSLIALDSTALEKVNGVF